MASEDVAAWLEENPQLIRGPLACGEADALVSKPFDHEEIFRVRTNIR